MPKFYKRWLLSWVIAGAVAPFVLAAIGHFVPPVPETGIFDTPPVLTLAQHRFQKAGEIVCPGQFVVGILSLVAMDSGVDSQWVGVTILIVALAINSGIYAGIGFLLIILIEACRSVTGRRSFLE